LSEDNISRSIKFPSADFDKNQDDFFRLLAENSRDMIFRITLPEWVCEYVNPAVEELFGFKPGEFYANPKVIINHIHPDWLPYLEEKRHKLLQGDVPPYYEYQIINKLGETRWVIQRNTMSLGPDGKPAALQGIVSDITEQKNQDVIENEQRLWAESLSSTAADLNSTLQLEEVLDRILVNIGKAVAHDAIDIMIIEGGVASIVRQKGYERFGLVETSMMLRYPIAELPDLEQVIKNQQPILIPDTYQHKGWVIFPDTSWIRCFVCIPIILNKEVWGFLNLNNSTPNSFSLGQVERLQAFANQAAAAINNARLFQKAQFELEERKRTEEVLRESEARMHAILEAVPDLLFRVKKDGTVVDYHARYKDLFNDFGLIVGSRIQELLPPQQAGLILNCILKTIATGKIQSIEFRLPGGKGGRGDYEIRLAPIAEAEAVAIVRNMTERKRIEEALRTSEERYRRLFEDSVLGIFQATLGGKDIEVNPAHAHMFGYGSSDELLASVGDGNDLFAEPSRHSETIRMILQSPLPITVENLYRRKDGSVFTGILHAWKVKDRAGHYHYIEGFVEDITLRKKTEENLQRHLKEQAALYTIVAAGTEPVSEEGLIEKVTKTVGKLFFSEDFAVLMLNEKTGLLKTLKPFQADLAQSSRVNIVPLGMGVTGQVAASGLPLRLGDVSNFPGYLRSNPETQSELCVPIKTEGKVLGVIDTESRRLNAFSEEDEHFLVAVADQLATAIARVRLLENLEERVTERTRYLSAIYEISAAASELTNIDHILKFLLEKTLDAMTCPMGMIHLLQNNPVELVLAVTQGFPFCKDIDLDDLFADCKPWGEVLDSNEPVHISPLENALRCTKKPDWLPGAYLGVLVRSKGENLGVLSIFIAESHDYSSEDVALMATIGEQIGSAVERARLHQKSEAMAVMEERHRLAGELHDSVTQSLYSVTLMAKGANKMASEQVKGKLVEYLQEISDTAQQALKEMRLLIYELRPSILAQDGLEMAIQKRLDAVEQHAGIKVNFQLDRSIKLPVIVEEGFYRITQEALNNILKHSEASTVTVSLNKLNNWVNLEIMDNGKGFELEMGNQHHGIGLQSMRERVERLGGKISVISKPGKGTRVKVSLLLTENKTPEAIKR
jgi:PAS domain S-box-containing protein